MEKQEMRPTIHMEKQLRWACGLGGAVSGQLQGKSNSVHQVDGISDIAPAYWLCERKIWQRDNGLCSP